MPRVYKPRPDGKRYKKYDDQIIKQALDELTLKNATIRSIAEKYNISRSVLQRHSTRKVKSPGGQMALTIEEENYIVQNLNTCAEWGYPLDVTDLRFLVKSYLDMLGVTNKRFKNNLPGRDFVLNFLERHKNNISQRLCQNIKRARASVSPSIISEYFHELEKSIEGVPLCNIINYDETNLSDDPGRHKVLTRRGCKYPERILNHSKASVSIMMAGTAEGELLPPYVVYKSTNLYDTWVKNGPEHARYNRTSSGWFDAEVFKDWIKQMVIPFFEKKPGKKVLLGDNLSSHLSMDLISLCKSHDIHFIFLPANSTHLTQPLDVAFFRPMKIAWRQILQKWKKTDGRSLSSVPKGCFPRMLKVLMDQIQINSANNLRAGFRKTGISPLNPNEVLARLPEEKEDCDVKDAIDKSIINLLNEMRYGSMNIIEQKNKRKIAVISGRSVSQDEIESYAETDSEPVQKKKRNQKINEPTNQLKNSSKGKGVGKKTKNICDEKENKQPSPTAHCSTFEKSNNLPKPDNEKEQRSDWSDIYVENMPIVLSEDLSQDEIESYAETDSEPVQKKKRNQKINEPTNQLKNSSKGKGVGKKTKNICDEKENKQPSPTAHCSTFEKSNNLPKPDNEKEQRSDWSDIDVENMPIVLSEDLEFYKEIIIPYEGKGLSASNAREETKEIGIEDEQALNNQKVRSRSIEENNDRDDKDATNEKANHADKSKIIITSNTEISQDQLVKLFPKTKTKQNIKRVDVNKKIKIVKKTPQEEKNYYNNTDEILKILEYESESE